jgi:hypothetical protein
MSHIGRREMRIEAYHSVASAAHGDARCVA